MKIPSYIWIIGTIILAGGFLLLLSSQKNNIDTTQGLPVQIEIFSDYNCSHCATFVPVADDISNTFGEKVTVEKKHAPFLSAETSYIYAYAAEAARLQGKFDDYNHQLFAWITYKKNSADTTFTYTDADKQFYSQAIDVNKLAERLSLDLVQFEIDKNSQEIKDLVLTQKAELTKRIGGISTPAIFIYGKYFNMSGLTIDALKTKVSELINTIENKAN